MTSTAARVRTLSLSTGLAVALAASLAGCGSEETAATQQAPSSPSSSSAPATPCPDAEKSWATAGPLARLDLDGDGRAEQVRLATSGTCAGGPVAQVGEARLGAPAPAGPPLVEARAARVGGVDGETLVVAQRHPMGGVQTRLYVLAEEQLTELTVEGKPPVPFIATDTTPQPIAASCTADGFTITRGEPAGRGVAPRWRLTRTSYAVSGGQATATAPEVVARAIGEQALARRYPPLVEQRLFADCPAG